MTQYRIWWIPQVPMDQPFQADVPDVPTAVLMLNTLAEYDQYQYEHRVKPDYCNAGGLEVHVDGGWEEWHDEDDRDIMEVIRRAGATAGALGERDG